MLTRIITGIIGIEAAVAIITVGGCRFAGVVWLLAAGMNIIKWPNPKATMFIR